MADTLVSIIIPVFNRRNVLKRALNSVLSQTFQHFEVLVIDDFSTDNPEEVINKFNDERIKYYRLEKKGNANVARNLGIRKAKGEYIAMLDSDDEFLPHHLERRLRKIQEWGCDGIFGSAKISHKDSETYKISRNFKSGETMVSYLLSDGFAPTPSHFYKKSAAENVLWDEELKRHQDYDFSIRFRDKYNFIPDSEPTVYIHWENDYVNHDFVNQKIFIEKYKADIPKNIFVKYNYYIVRESAKRDIEYKIRKYYIDNCKDNIKYLSLYQYLYICGATKFPKSAFYKLKFSIYNLI